MSPIPPDAGYDELQAELDDLGSTPGTIVLPPGTIDDVDDNVTVPPNTWLRGAGPYSTTLKFADGTDLDVAGLVRVTGDNVVVSDLGVDGNRATVTNDGQEYGVYVTGTTNLTLSRLYVRNCPGYGIDPHSRDGTPATNLLVRGCVATNNGMDGITLAGIERATVAGCFSQANDRHGFNSTDAEGERVGFVGCHAHDNDDCGLTVQNATGETQIVGGTFVGNETGMRLGSSGGEIGFSTVQSAVFAHNGGYGINVRGSNSVAILGSVFRANAQRSGNADVSLQTTGSGSLGSNYNTIMGCTFEQEDQTYGVDERSGSGPNVVVGCTFRGPYSTAVNLSHPDSNETATLT